MKREKKRSWKLWEAKLIFDEKGRTAKTAGNMTSRDLLLYLIFLVDLLGLIIDIHLDN